MGQASESETLNWSRGALSYQAIGTALIALTIIAVGTLLIIEFSTPVQFLGDKTHSTISDTISNIFGGEKKDYNYITGEFKADRIAKMIRRCWQGNKEKSKICYVLKGKMSATKADVRGKLSTQVSSHLKINTSLTSGPLTIKYYKPQDLIVVN